MLTPQLCHNIFKPLQICSTLKPYNRPTMHVTYFVTVHLFHYAFTKLCHRTFVTPRIFNTLPQYIYLTKHQPYLTVYSTSF